MKRVYLDHNSTSPMRPEAREAWLRALDGGLANPSSLHRAGRRARHAVDEARERVAAALGVTDDEITFTASGTESNNLAVLGAVGDARAFVTTAVEHSSVLELARVLRERGRDVAVVEPDAEGRVDASSVADAARSFDGESVVSVQLANNETGSVQPVQELAEIERAVLHVDGVQALGRLPLQLRTHGIDLASFSAHKVGGPVGVGVLYKRSNVRISPILVGGGQESGVRPGTENAAAIAAAGVAIELAVQEQEAYRERTRALVEGLWRDISTSFPDARVVGPAIGSPHRLSNTLTVLFPGTDGKVLVTALDVAGLEVSAGSACASGAIEPSHVLRAMRFDDDEARAGLRLSVGWNTTRDDCNTAVEILRKVVTRSRAT